MDYSIIIQLILLDIFLHTKVQWSYHIVTCAPYLFINFRGEDTRHSFTSLLYDALLGAGIDVFFDEVSIGTGRQIDCEIVEAINESMGAIIVFSKGYASSPWCLEELVLILERKRQLGSSYLLMPIYVDGVQPDDIFASYGKALDEHNKWYWCINRHRRKRVKAWRAALREVGGYKGRILDGYWGKFINCTVKDVREEFLAMGFTIYPQGTNPTKRKYIPVDSSTFYELIKQLVTMLIAISIPHLITYKLPVLQPFFGKFIDKNGYLLNVSVPTALSNVRSMEIWKEIVGKWWNLFGFVRGVVVLLCGFRSWWSWFGLLKVVAMLVYLSCMILIWLVLKWIRRPEANLTLMVLLWMFYKWFAS